MEPDRAVLTGDLVDSTKASPSAVDHAMSILSGAAAEVADWRYANIEEPVGNTYFTRFRGDGWQILVSIAAFDLRAALFLYARLAACPDLPATRIAVGVSSVDHVPGPDLSDAHGPAFAVSGRALAEMERGERLRMAGSRMGDDDTTRPIITAFVGLLDDRIADWTPEQAEAMACVLPPEAPTQSAIAATLGITPQALSSRLSGARWRSIRQLLDAWELRRCRKAAS
jgi:hypothetical protein